jgi:hypothetical protein
MLKYVGDFETTTNPNDLRVWASCLVNIDSIEVEYIDNNIESMFEFLKNKNSEIWFHNEKFDGEFIISYLLKNGYEHTDTKKPKTFQTLITDTGIFYSITIYFDKKNKKYNKCTIYDSLKLIPMPVTKVAKAFNLKESKLEIDYDEERPLGHILTEDEIKYIQADCIIVAKALHQMFEEGLNRMTIGSNALHGFKNTISRKRFELWFPILDLEVDKLIRLAYKGGYTYLNPKFKNKRLQGIVFDVNSLYPWAMYEKPMPYGIPIYFEGKYKDDKNYPLYIQNFECQFEIKPKRIPTVQLKNNLAFNETEYLKSSNDRIETLTMTNIDMQIFFEQYNVYNIQYNWGFKFKSCTGVFNNYIDKWMEVKANSEGGKRQIAKLMLNSLYGKFATNPRKQNKIPYLDDKNIVRYMLSEEIYVDPIYTPMSCFITAWARDKTIRTCQAHYDRFIYADTDSLHINGLEIPQDIDIHKSRLGAWKNEGEFIDSKYLRAKTYMHTLPNGELEIKCAGMPDNVKENVTYDNFKIGGEFFGKLSPKHFDGGIILIPSPFKIRK